LANPISTSASFRASIRADFRSNHVLDERDQQPTNLRRISGQGPGQLSVCHAPALNM